MRRNEDDALVKKRFLSLSLLRVCRQTYTKVALSPYEFNNSVFENRWVMTKVTKTLRPVHIQILKAEMLCKKQKRYIWALRNNMGGATILY